MHNTFQLSELYRSLFDLYNYAESEEEQSSILLQIENVESLIENKIDQLHRAWRNKVAEIAGPKAELERLKTYVARLEKEEEDIKLLLKEIMIRSNILRTTTSVGKLWVQNNSAPSVILEGDPKDLPDKYRVVVPMKYEADKKAIAGDYGAVLQRIGELEKEFYEANPTGGQFDREQAEIQARRELGYPLNVIVSRGNHLKSK